MLPLKSILYNYEINGRGIIGSLMHFHFPFSSHRTRIARCISDTAFERTEKTALRISYFVPSEMNRKKAHSKRERARDVGR